MELVFYKNYEGFLTIMSIDHVLIIEDDEVSTMLLGYLIEDVLNVKSIIAKVNGDEALAYLEGLISTPAQFPDLIFLDLNMPQMSGYDFLKLYEEKFAAHAPYTQLIVLTSSVRKQDREITQQYPSVAGFFNKPLEEDQLRQIKVAMKTVKRHH